MLEENSVYVLGGIVAAPTLPRGNLPFYFLPT